MAEKLLEQNSEFLFGFEAVLTNPNGDPDQENRPRLDYETATALVSDARRKRDCRDFLKKKGYRIFVDTLAEQKVSMEQMFEQVVKEWLTPERLEELCNRQPLLREKGQLLWGDISQGVADKYFATRKNSKESKKSEFIEFNNILLTEIIKRALIDIRLFGSAMAVEGVTRTYTGPVQITWGYSLHPVELVRSNTITSIMSEGNSTFGKKHKLHYALIAHYGTINKYSARLTGMSEEDRDVFRKALVQGMMNNQTDSKQGQLPLFYLEIIYNKNFDGYLGDLRRFCRVTYQPGKAIRSLSDLTVDFQPLQDALQKMRAAGYVEKVLGWLHPSVVPGLLNEDLAGEVALTGIAGDLWNSLIDERVDLWQQIENPVMNE